MEALIQVSKQIHSPLYDRRLMILILKKTNGRRSFSENCRVLKIKEEHRYRHHEPNAQTQRQPQKENTEENFRISDPSVFAE